MAKRSFWSTMPGIITGIAGLLSATAALVGLLVTFGVIGGKDSSTAKDSGAATEDTGGGSTATTAAAVPTFSVQPTSVSLDQLLAKEAKVTVKNTGEAPLSVQTPTVRGGDAAQFGAQDVSCTDAKVPAGESCEMKVVFTPKGNGRYSATLVVTVKGAPAPAEVRLSGAAAL